MDGNLLIDNIRFLCKERNISIRKLESDLFLSPGLISRWNKNIPAIDKVMDIAQYLGVTIDELVGRPQKKNDQINIDQLLLILYNHSLAAHIDWDILNFQALPAALKNITPSSLSGSESCDCYYADYKDGFFILAITHSLSDDIQLALFVLPDIYSKPECICSDANRLTQLYEYLNRRFAKKLNKMKSANFMNAFIADANIADAPTDESTEKVTPLLRSVNGGGEY